jgi:tRNA dimethylallyltransferase
MTDAERPLHPWPLVAVTGPTCSGKSRAAMFLAGKLGGEILNADSRQIYRGFNIGTAKPSPEDRGAIPHHLYDTAEPWETFSAGRYQRLADQAVAEAARRGRLPILAGGTGFYMKALTEGLFEAGEAAPHWKARLRGERERRGAPFMHRLLERVDPQAARCLRPGDAQRVLRALEVFFATGEPLSRHHLRHRKRRRYACVWVGLALPRERHIAALEARFEAMLEAGWLDEVRRLMAEHPPEAKAWESHGYREAAAYLREPTEENFRKFREDTLRAQRRYAKRQRTWFRAVRGMTWFDASGDGVEEKILVHVRGELAALRKA